MIQERSGVKAENSDHEDNSGKKVGIILCSTFLLSFIGQQCAPLCCTLYRDPLGIWKDDEKCSWWCCCLEEKRIYTSDRASLELIIINIPTSTTATAKITIRIEQATCLHPFSTWSCCSFHGLSPAACCCCSCYASVHMEITLGMPLISFSTHFHLESKLKKPCEQYYFEQQHSLPLVLSKENKRKKEYFEWPCHTSNSYHHHHQGWC